MIGFGATLGTHGILLGIGVITRVGGTLITVGHMIGTGITATPIIITTTAVRSAMHIIHMRVIVTCITAFLIGTMLPFIRIALLSAVTVE